MRIICNRWIYWLILSRFWLCRAVESWLRSSSSFRVADQLFVISRGLLQHIVNVLLESEPRSMDSDGVAVRPRMGGTPELRFREVAQSSFDLLGELIRFNMEACRQLDTLLNTDSKVNFSLLINFIIYCWIYLILNSFIYCNLSMGNSHDHYFKSNLIQSLTFQVISNIIHFFVLCVVHFLIC